MPTNQQRREAAKRKLDRQLVRRQELDKKRRQRLLVVGVIAAVLVVVGVVYFATRKPSATTAAKANPTDTSATATSPAAPTTPCSYPTAAAAKAAKAAAPPANLSPANTGTVDAKVNVNGQEVPVTLDRAAAPCTVNSFVSLASQGFYNSTDCWRETASPALSVLQCGDPSGKGSGGPGYQFADELKDTKGYPAGTLAMANSGPDTNGSQFFFVYKDSTLPASYTAFGKVSAAGMKVIGDVAAKGVKNNAQDGAPNAKVTIDSVTVPSDAVTAIGSYAPTQTADSGSGVIPTDSVATGGSPSVQTSAVGTSVSAGSSTAAPATSSSSSK